MPVTIDKWFGRLGNNIQQVSNAIYFCKKNKMNFVSPKHNMFDQIRINFGNDSYYSSRFFFFNGPEKDFFCKQKELRENRKKIINEFVVPKIRLKKIDLKEDVLVIHIRSGDIFNGSPHNQYVQNPLHFYERIAKNYSNVILVTQDMLNPVTKELIKNKKIKLQIGSTMEDFSTLAAATNLVSSGVGTFSVAAALCSSRLKNFYCTDLYLKEHMNFEDLKADKKINVSLTKLNDYIKLGDWNNTKTQKEKIINYRIK